MLLLQGDQLIFTFPDYHPEARLEVSFQRTLRIPDDGRTYPLPPGLGLFPMRLVDDFPARVPRRWLNDGGVMLPMYQSEAMWIRFSSTFIPERGTSYPMALKIGAGNINAVTGDPWVTGLQKIPQDHVVVPGQPWLDGFCVEKGLIRQFVAMPLGAGYTAEEQITGQAEHGGVQLIAYPMRKEIFEEKFPVLPPEERSSAGNFDLLGLEEVDMLMAGGNEMGLAPGGKMKQDIYVDKFAPEDYDDGKHRCMVHIANSLSWKTITGNNPPTEPFASRDYTTAGLPWFDYYDDARQALSGSARLAALKSVAEMNEEEGDAPLPDNESITPNLILKIRMNMGPDEVRESPD